MGNRLIRLLSLFAILPLAASCSMYKDYEASQPANVMELEARLERAGFRRIPIETPEQNGAVAALPLHRLNRYQSAQGSIFWYADPTVCSCLYEGDQMAYNSYAGQLQQEHDTAEYVNDAQPEQVANLSPFGYAFPPPLFLGGWPVMTSSGGPIHYGGGGGSGVTPRGGGGGGVHSAGHGGHGGSNGGVHGRH